MANYQIPYNSQMKHCRKWVSRSSTQKIFRFSFLFFSTITYIETKIHSRFLCSDWTLLMRLYDTFQTFSKNFSLFTGYRFRETRSLCFANTMLVLNMRFLLNPKLHKRYFKKNSNSDDGEMRNLSFDSNLLR